MGETDLRTTQRGAPALFSALAMSYKESRGLFLGPDCGWQQRYVTMSVHAQCPVCGEEFRRPDSMAGKREKCPECHAVLRLPTTTQPPMAPSEGGQPQGDVSPDPAPQPAAQPAQENPAATSPSKESEKREMVPAKKSKASAKQAAAVAAPGLEPQPELSAEMLPESETCAEPPAPEQGPLPSDDIFEDEIFSLAEPPLLKPATPLEQPAPLEEDAGQRDAYAIVETAAEPRAEAIDYPSQVAKAVCAGRPPDAVAVEAVEQGMDESEAAEMVVFMFEAYQGYRPPKGTSWVKLLGGLLLLIIDAPVFLAAQSGEGSSPMSPILQYSFLALAVVGLVLFFAGLWRLIRPCRLSARQLIAAWQQRNA